MAEANEPESRESHQMLFDVIKNNNAELLEDLLAKETKESLLLVDDKKATLLHQAAVASKPHTLPIVLAALQRFGIVSDCLRQVDSHGDTPLIWSISSAAYFENFTALIKSCDKHCPGVLRKTNVNGENLLHCAVKCEAPSVLKALLARDDMKEELLMRNKGGHTPFQAAQVLATRLKMKFDMEKNSFEQTAKLLKWNDLMKATTYKGRFYFLEKEQKVVSDIVAVLDHPTAEIKAVAAAREAAESQNMKIAARKKELEKNCNELLTQGNVEGSLAMILSKDSLEQEVALQVVASYFQSLVGLDETKIPVLSSDLVAVFENLIREGGGSSALNPLTILSYVCQKNENLVMLCANEKLLTQLGRRVKTRHSDVQLHCLCIMKLCLRSTELIKNKPAVKSWTQSLLLLKFHGSSSHVRKQAESVLDKLQDESRLDPGSWTVQDVLLWMDSKEDLQERDAYAKQFIESGIDGLYLLDLSHEDMKGLGVRYLSERRKMISHIDDLRRLNAPSFVGPKDIFLSYSHTNVNFAVKLKTALNEAKYSVWIDTAGIRAGVKWRDAIASGIETCKAFVYVMNARSVSSEYCLDEVALAEDVKKPIFTVTSEKIAFSAIDPGLKLMISRRQWTDFSNESACGESFQKLLTGLSEAIGEGTFSSDVNESEADKVLSSRIDLIPTNSASGGAVVQKHADTVEKESLLSKVSSLENRVMWLETTVVKLSELIRLKPDS